MRINAKQGLCVLNISGGNKMACVLICVSYTPKIVAWSNANLYDGGECTIKGNYYTLNVTIKANSITGDETMASSCRIVG